MTIIAPTGTQHTITAGGLRAVVTEVGAGLRELTHEGRPLVLGYGESETPFGSAGLPLLPWPNRIEDGKYDFDGQTRQLAITEPKFGNASHGLTRTLPWRAETHEESSIRLGLRLFPQPGYPHILDLGVTYTLDPSGLTVEFDAHNLGGSDAPYGFGAHPYLTLGGPVDDAVLELPASRWLSVDERKIPVAGHDVDGTPYDFRTPRPVGGTALDTAFTGLTPGPDGVVRVRLTGGSHGVELWAGEGVRWLQLFTGDALPGPYRRAGLAVEPMSCPPNAFRTGEDVIRIAPGTRTGHRWGIRPL
ncbi:aldose 1-epimerase family protein [Sphaerisporangium rubeum]|uniref:Aldose 1-epimerase n=1 Tax=Sphaerisporangium rubeum TaxID=321317 RepID=A0A7X0M4W9_9ACTN|nr:aldose 1-epimerase family protein [Sphaerisporangium rubeum]MBB6471602.1 aldose 1-epimerase [Sphaerisporangium rubeum]